MATKLEKPIRRELELDGVAFMITIDPQGLKIVKKAHRKGLELTWKELISGDAALATALNASLEHTTT